MWRSKVMNVLTDWWALPCFYGFSQYLPGYQLTIKIHHKFNNREGDDSITYRVSEKNNFPHTRFISNNKRLLSAKRPIAQLSERHESEHKEKFWGKYSPQYVVACNCG